MNNFWVNLHKQDFKQGCQGVDNSIPRNNIGHGIAAGGHDFPGCRHARCRRKGTAHHADSQFGPHAKHSYNKRTDSRTGTNSQQAKTRIFNAVFSETGNKAGARTKADTDNKDNEAYVRNPAGYVYTKVTCYQGCYEDAYRSQIDPIDGDMTDKVTGYTDNEDDKQKHPYITHNKANHLKPSLPYTIRSLTGRDKRLFHRTCDAFHFTF